MAVFRIEKNSDFTIMPNYPFRDMRLSFKGRGLLGTMLHAVADDGYPLRADAVADERVPSRVAHGYDGVVPGREQSVYEPPLGSAVDGQVPGVDHAQTRATPAGEQGYDVLHGVLGVYDVDLPLAAERGEGLRGLRRMRRAHVDAQALYAHRGHFLAQLAGDVVGEEAALPTAREDTR